MLTLQGCTPSYTLSPLTAVYTTCTQQPSSGSPARVSAIAYLNTRVSSPGLSPIQVPSAGSPAEVSTYGPERCVQGSGTPNGSPACPAMVYLPHHSPPLWLALRTASSTLQTPKTTCNSWTEDRGVNKSSEVIFQGPTCGSSCSWITNRELSS